MRVSTLQAVAAFTTLDGSTVRELAGPGMETALQQSLAEATVDPGGETAEHFHRETEEIYFFTGGAGRMRLGDEEREVSEGDCVVIPPGASHKLWNTSAEPLTLLCCCAPAYRHEDTVLT